MGRPLGAVCVRAFVIVGLREGPSTGAWVRP